MNELQRTSPKPPMGGNPSGELDRSTAQVLVERPANGPETRHLFHHSLFTFTFEPCCPGTGRKKQTASNLLPMKRIHHPVEENTQPKQHQGDAFRLTSRPPPRRETRRGTPERSPTATSYSPRRGPTPWHRSVHLGTQQDIYRYLDLPTLQQVLPTWAGFGVEITCQTCLQSWMIQVSRFIHWH